MYKSKILKKRRGKTIGKETRKEIDRILKKVLNLDIESYLILSRALEVAIYENVDYHKFNMRYLLSKVDSTCTVKHMESHVSKNLRNNWDNLDDNELYATFDTVEKLTPKVIMMFLIEKIRRKEI